MDPERKRRLLHMAKLALIAGGAFSIVPAGYLAVRAYRHQVAVFFPKRKPVALSANASALPRLEEVSFPSNGKTVRGWYSRPLNGGAVILLHGAGGDRSSLVVEARALSSAGFGVLSFDSPGHGESEGEIRWSEPERSALQHALDWLVQRAEVDARRIGALGFSLGGYVLAQVAANEARLSAIGLCGTPSDPVLQVNFQHRHFGKLTQLPALHALRRGGMDLEVRARDFVGKIAPRPVLIVTGTDDGTVPRSMADELYATAKHPKSLEVIEGAGHGGYESAAPGRYPALVVEFFERSFKR